MFDLTIGFIYRAPFWESMKMIMSAFFFLFLAEAQIDSNFRTYAVKTDQVTLVELEK